MNVNRKNVNETEYSASDFPKSGFNLGYKNYASWMLGRIHVTGYQHIMPNDKYNGVNSGNVTFRRLTSPTLSDIEVSQHNFFLPYRCVDTTFEDALAPGVMNGMSANWRTPTITIRVLAEATLYQFNIGYGWPSDLDENPIDQAELDSWYNNIFTSLYAPTPFHSTPIYQRAKQLYMTDYLDLDWWQYWTVARNSIVVDATPRNVAFKTLLSAILTPFVGKTSLLNELGYSYLRSYDIDSLFEISAGYPRWSDYTEFMDLLDDIPMCEYALRIYYAIWYEMYRSPVLEPVSTTLPNYRKFGGSSVIEPLMLLVRCRSWQQDIFVNASPDDICRHVFAPILTTGTNSVTSLKNDENFLYAEANDPNNKYRNIVAQTLSYLDPSTGQTKSIVCPVPGLVNDAISHMDSGTTEVPYSLDMFNLRKTSMFERYLKRNLAFGDEYKNRMLAHYGAVVSDERVNRPLYLSGSVDPVDISQQVANVGTDKSNPGDRSIIVSATASNDGYTGYSEEFGMVINLASFMPKAQYAGICPQNLLSKVVDFPVAEFAANNEECGRILEIATSGLKKSDVDTLGLFAHYPYAHAWRSRVDEVHGDFLDELADCTFRRFFGLDSGSDSIPKLNSSFIHCHPNLSMFANTILLDGQMYGFFKHSFNVERVLPTPVETI